MENFEHKEYRNYVAKDLREVHKDDPEKAADVLEAMQKTSNYKQAKEKHRQDQYYERNKDQIVEEQYINIINRFSKYSTNNEDYFSEIENLKRQTGVNLSLEVIQKGYKKLLYSYKVRESMEGFKKITSIEPEFTEEEKREVILDRFHKDQWSGFRDIIEYVGQSLKKETVDSIYPIIAENLKSENRETRVIAIEQIYDIYKQTGIKANLDTNLIQKLYTELFDELLVKLFANSGENIWRINRLHEATGISYPNFDKMKVQALYDKFTKEKVRGDIYSNGVDRLIKFEEITGIKRWNSNLI